MELFPNGSQIIPTDGSNLQCGFRAVINSLASMKENGHNVQFPTLHELEEVYENPTSKLLLKDYTLDQDEINYNHYYVDQVALTVKMWAELRGLVPLRLGWVMEGRPPFLVPWKTTSDQQKPTVFFIHNDATEFSDDAIHHFSGLAPLITITKASFIGAEDASLASGECDGFNDLPRKPERRSSSQNRDDWDSTVVATLRDIAPHRPLTLDMGVSWPRLQWSRPKFYPFLNTTLNVARLANLIKYQPYMSLPYQIICLMMRWVYSSRPSLASRIGSSLALVCVIGLRTLVIAGEHSWMTVYSDSGQRASLPPFKNMARLDCSLRLNAGS